MYGWVKTFNNSKEIKYISVKKPLKNPLNDPIVVGTFTFKKLEYFTKSFSNLKKNKGKINNEYYLDSCINEAIKLNYRCYIFEIDHYLCWGTPNDLKTFEYWQACFSRWKFHKYNIKNDKRISAKYFSNEFYD